ncbi:TPA: phage tail protein [Pseudomonas aeruginosa]|uniref:phage tail-collar fiber domain-containing protein n=2 Tax=Pseudomonas aeruginosa TaxID=287 RepID=UPI0008FB9F7F|nr:phage tail protein [Pseudomonas aeruginosa]KSK40376.2 phage tail protein [Pseudomonas aeruginosa]MBG4915211.1 phage tail protein [Pseudomonas aeruginosa]MBG4926072.1 phage tail protein [Pseudomonas aeruginosa]MBG5556558.1 phage tail protein [Pseudomonas aeruginosa]MBG5568344.1 phage tail protein [Pseudomonas aeruginosa]
MTTPKYGGLLTDIGATALIAASEAGKKWQPTHMLIGDAGGAPGETADPIPSAAQTKLIRQRYRAQLNRLFVSEQSANVLIAELVLPMAIGGFWIREIGLEDADGKFVAVANCPPSFKASVESGSARTQTIRVQIIISGMEHVELIIDDGIVYATQDWVKAKVAADFKGRKVMAGNGLVGGGDLSADRTIALPASGVGAGTYRAVTVNANGIVTTGSNPTTLGGYGITDALHASEAVTTPTANKLLRLNAAGLLPASITGNATTASRLAAPITLSATGDATWAARFDGSSSVSGTLTLANTGVAVGTYTKVRVNAKGLVTSATSLTADDIPWLDASKLATGILPVARGGTGNAIGQAATALKLASPRTLAIAGDAIGSAAFDGSANASITVTLANTGVADGTYTKVRVNPKGLVIGATTLTTDDIPSLDASKITSGMFADARLPWYAQGLCTSAPNTTDPNTTNIPLILTNHENGPIPGQYFYIQTMMYNQRNGNAGQIAVRYAANAEMYVRYMYDVGNKRGVWSAWRRCDVGGSFAKEPDSRIGDAFDLNTLEESGWWYQTSNTYAANGANYPTAKAGRLMVYRTTSDFIYQTYQTHDGYMFHRCRYVGTWQPWREQWTTLNFNPANYVPTSGYSWASLPGKPANFPPSGHNHDAGQITSGILPLARGGLGANNAVTARSNIGAGTIATASLGASGWWRDNDTGYIRQWGVTASLGQDSSATITFPMVFPRAVFGANWKQRAPGLHVSQGNQVITSLTTTNMTIYQGDDTAGPVYWEAWGY